MFAPLLVQLSSRVGDLAANANRLAAMLLDAEDFALAVVPELAIAGYPSRDLLELEGFADAVRRELDALAQRIAHRGPVLVGAIAESDRSPGLVNAAWLLHGGEARVVAEKQLLVDYDVFDEPRHFAPGRALPPLELCGRRIGVTICEDFWGGDEVGQGHRYASDPAAALVAAGCDTIVNLSASPYQRNKPAGRIVRAERFAAEHGVTVAVANAMGANDELIFDGHSFVTDGSQTFGLAGFVEEARIPTAPPQLADPIDADRQALVLGLREYITKSGGNSVVLGISGGIDSALVAAIAVDALGADRVLGVAMPSRFSSDRSVDDARRLCANLGMELRVLPIREAHRSLSLALGQQTDASGLTDENLQARLRGVMVMAFANAEGRFALATGNKSELAVGYCTMYGDMCGALAPIGDLFKTDVFAMSARDSRIPRSIVDAPPSAELRSDQLDEDSLPPYAQLDAALAALIVDRRAPASIVASGQDEAVVARAVALLDRNEFKRRQGAPVLRVSAKAFGMGRRMPLAWRRGF